MSDVKADAKTIFLEALERQGREELLHFLDEACGGDSALRARVEELLRAHHDAESFLNKPALQCAVDEIEGKLRNEQTQGEPLGGADGNSLGFLAPSPKPGVLGELGHYDILEIIGRGGMGIVLRAFDNILHRVVAIKVMAAQLATSGIARKRFTREAQAAAAVSHDHIVTIHAVEESAGHPYLVMQFVSGMSLQERIDRNGSLQLEEIVRIAMQTAAGLAAAHAQGLVHRDIKPANILLENGIERVKITDFGLARAATEASLTQSGVVAGTPHYMSPEQAEGKGIDQRTDLFSLGSVLYAMCTGRVPFRASGSMAVLKRVCEETPTPIRETNPGIPDWLVAIIDKLHAKDPAERFQSATEVAELLSRHLAHVQHPSMAPFLPASPMRRGAGGRSPARRRWAIAAAICLCLLAGLALTEATGVTNLWATVVGIFTPEGTFIVEADDPGVEVTFADSPGWIQCVAVSPDGRYAVSSCHDTIARLWDFKTGKEIRQFKGHTSEVFSVVFSSDSRRVLSGGIYGKGGKGAVRLWDVETGKQIRSFTTRTNLVNSVAISPDGHRAVYGGYSGVLGLLDLDTGDELTEFVGHDDDVYNVAYSPDGRYVLSGSHDKTVRLWDVKTGKEHRRFKDHSGRVWSVAFSADGRHILSGSGGHSVPNGWDDGFDDTVRLWETETGKELMRLEGHTDIVRSVTFSPDGRRALSGSNDCSARLWDLTTGKELCRYLMGHSVCSVAFSPDGRQALASNSNGNMRLWKLPPATKAKQPILPAGDSTADPDRDAAEWVLSIGGGIKIKENGEERQTGAVGDLPRSAFQLTVVNLAQNPNASDSGLAHFKDCKNVTELYLQSTKVSDVGLAHFKDCKNLTWLHLFGTKVSDVGLAYFKDCKNLTHLTLAGTNMSDAGLANFKDCTNLTQLYLVGTEVGDVGLANFKDCKNLMQLSLAGTNVSDAGLANFKDCTNLANLFLSNTSASDAGLAHFKDCTNLVELSLHGTNVSDAGLAHFKDCKNLKGVSLAGTDVSDAGLAHFKDCKNLTQLHLFGTEVGDVGLANFKDCKNLMQLTLAGTNVSDAGVVPFKDCKKLFILTLQRTKVTAAGIDELKKALPKCRIEWDGGVIEPQAAAPKVEANAFVLLAGKGFLERKFNTLAEAVEAASNGDTIEVRGNGPFISRPIKIRTSALTIRAGEGFRPIIRLDPEGVEQQLNLIWTTGPLVLEGLELQRLEKKLPKERHWWNALVLAEGPSLHMANCRLFQPQQYTCIFTTSPVCELRNCEILSGVEGGSAVSAQCHPKGRFVMTNCLQTGGGLIFSYKRPDVSDFLIRLTQNTLVEDQLPCLALTVETEPKPPKGAKLVRVEAFGNILDSPTGPLRVEHREAKLRPPGDAAAWLPQLVAWEGEGNLYSVEGSYILLGIGWGVGERYTKVKSLKDWQQLWASPERDSLAASAKYHGGDLGSRLAVAPEKITPQDFRLHADNPGYRAGKDGKDLGADVDLVGPGPAYERWQKTPEYQQWLKDTAQVKK